MAKKIERIYCIVATYKNEVISLTARPNTSEKAGLIHNLLGVKVQEDSLREVYETIICNRTKIDKVLELFIGYSDYKEIEFLKQSLIFLSNNPDIKHLKLSFYND
jgi:hypothetical protein